MTAGIVFQKEAIHYAVSEGACAALAHTQDSVEDFRDVLRLIRDQATEPLHGIGVLGLEGSLKHVFVETALEVLPESRVFFCEEPCVVYALGTEALLEQEGLILWEDRMESVSLKNYEGKPSFLQISHRLARSMDFGWLQALLFPQLHDRTQCAVKATMDEACGCVTEDVAELTCTAFDSFAGITDRHGPGHFVKAAYYAWAEQVRDVLRQESAWSGVRRIVLTEPLHACRHLKSILEEVLNKKIVLSAPLEAGCAAYAAYLSAENH